MLCTDFRTKEPSMRMHGIIWIGVAAVALLASSPLFVSARTGPAKKSDARKPLPPEVVKAWTDAGAEVTWMRVGEWGSITLDLERTGDVPAFLWRAWRDTWRPNVLNKLPDPGTPFLPQPFFYRGDRRRAGGTGRLEELASAGPFQHHQGDGHGAEESGRAEEPDS